MAEAVDAQVKAIEYEFAQKHVKLLRAFLPDNFTKPGGIRAKMQAYG